MKAIILAGGKGIRLGNISKTTPKVMTQLNKKPLLQYQIELLKKNGITDITLITHHLNNKISNYFGDGKKFGVKISYVHETSPLGTAGSIGKIATNFKNDFLVFYGDLLINMDISKFIKFHKKNKGLATLVVHPNNHPSDSDITEVDKNNKITKIYFKPHSKDLIYHNLINAAVYILSPKIEKFIPKNIPSDFGKDIFPELLSKKQKVFAYKTYEYILDIGTQERINIAKKDLKGGIYKAKSLKSKTPAIFFDRDGVINKEVDLIRRVEDVELLPGAAKAIKRVNNSKFLAIVIANQPQAAKGLCSVEMLDNINKKVETLLGQQGSKLDGLYMCIHHPDTGFPGENKKLKIICKCRKPETGMIKLAVKDFNIDIKNSFFIGDMSADAKAAENIKIPFIGVRTGHGCKDNKHNIKIPLIKTGINDAVNYILSSK